MRADSHGKPNRLAVFLLGVGVFAIIPMYSLALQLFRAVPSKTQTIHVGDLDRTYRLYIPKNLPDSAPLVFAFHGGGSDGAGMERLTKFDLLADREGFIVAYPNGIDKHWNDGRNMSQADDVAFVSAMIDAIGRIHTVDPKRVYATGMSNGGIFSHYLALKLSDRIAAIAPTAGGIAEGASTSFPPKTPVSVFMINGVADPLVPYHGGAVARINGHVIATRAAADLWIKADACQTVPAKGSLKKQNLADGCTVRWSKWTNGQTGNEVLLYTIDGGGHTWPGGAQYLPKAIVGRVCEDFDATEVIWDFFKDHPKK